MSKESLGYRILYFPLTKIIIGVFVVVGVYGVSGNLLQHLLKNDWFEKDARVLIVSVVATILVMFAYILLYKFYEKREITEFSTQKLFKNLVCGFLLGGILQALTILVIYLNGGYKILSVNPIYFVILPLAMSFSSAIFEEILFRGVIFRIMEEKLGSYISLVVSAFLFGMIHLLNPNSSLVAGIGLAIQAGLLLAAAYIYMRNLWFPIAIHFAWNFTQSAIFGANVSGNTLSKTLITSEISGAEWFTGGGFGPEGSFQATLFCLIATIILLFLSHKEGKIIRPYWRNKD